MTKKKAERLWPLSQKQRKYLSLTYRTIEKHGRIPTVTEFANYLGWGINSTERVRLITGLIKKGWVRKTSLRGWWPIGVDRHMEFKHPATMFVKHKTSKVQLDNMRAAEGEPESMERLGNLARIGISLGLHPDDALTIHWAFEQLARRGEVSRALAHVQGRRKDGKVWVPVDLLLDLEEAFPPPVLTELEVAIHFGDGPGAGLKDAASESMPAGTAPGPLTEKEPHHGQGQTDRDPG